MSKQIWNLLKTTPVILGASLLAANGAIAAPETNTLNNEGETLEQIEQYNNELGSSSDSMSQVTSVSQLRDVSPGDWAYEALRTLVERYGCIVGYPDQTFRGNQATSRYEFAAGLNACLQQMERLIAASEAVLREDIERLQLLMQEFEAELAALGARVDNLEGRVAFLEDHNFSTTTKLQGSVIMALGAPLGNDQAQSPFNSVESDDEISNSAFLSYRARLDFNTSFTGEDRLTTRLQAGNVANLAKATGTDAARLGFDGDSEDNVFIDKLDYTTPLGDNFRLYIAATGYSFDDIADPKNPFFESDQTGALSRFSRRNPAVYRTGNSALGLNWGISEQFSVDVAYLVGAGANDPSKGKGVFDGNYLAMAQFNWDPTEKIGVAVTYGYGYEKSDDLNLSGSTGSPQAKNPFRDNVGATAHRFGVQGTWRIGERFNIAGWWGGVLAQAQSGEFDDGNSAFIWNTAVNFSVLDLLREGSHLGLVFGIPPRTDYRNPDDMTYFVEALYKYPITDNISITPGAYVIVNPNQDSDNDTIIVGSIRTTFKF